MSELNKKYQCIGCEEEENHFPCFDCITVKEYDKLPFDFREYVRTACAYAVDANDLAERVMEIFKHDTKINGVTNVYPPEDLIDLKDEKY